MITVYRAGSTWLYRVPPAVKIISLLVISTGLFVVREPLVLLVALALISVAWATNGFSILDGLLQFRLFFAAILFYAVFEGLLVGWMSAAVIVLRMVTLILAACLLSMTTRTSHLLALLERVLTPLRRFGVHPARASFALSMTIRFIPLLADRAREVREAAWARGVDRRPIALIVPLLIEGLRMADSMVEAVEARGVGGLE